MCLYEKEHLDKMPCLFLAQHGYASRVINERFGKSSGLPQLENDKIEAQSRTDKHRLVFPHK